MSSFLILVRSSYSDVPTLESIREFHETVWKELKSVDGFEDAQVWVDTSAPERHLILYRYKSVEAADAGLKVVSRDRILKRSQSVQRQAADVMRIRLVKHQGQIKDHLSDVKILSISIRIAEPGYAETIQEDLEVVFQECMFLKGFCGYAIGVNDALEEEVIGLAAWDTMEAFKSSLPQGVFPLVESYQKLW